MPLEVSHYQGIASYDPAEFLISARAGTRISDIQQALAQNGQYLPFDPLFVAKGATLGGTIASGISGPDRLLYGGIRDFIMEIAMIDGLGKFVRGGGKVVKNAAGFDTPKMMVGSYGRMGVIVEATLKVFPAPQAWATLLFDSPSIHEALRLAQRILSKPFPIAGLDINPENQVSIRLAAPASSLPGAAERIESLAALKSRFLAEQQHVDHRAQLTQWLESPIPDGQSLIRVSMSPIDLIGLHRMLDEMDLRDYLFCCAACCGWIKAPASTICQLSEGLQALSLSAVLVRGQINDSAIGSLDWQKMAARIQSAIDPSGTFASWS